jgi:hypothetical protein
MRKMDIAALGPKPRTSKPAPGHKIFPHLLRGLAIERVNRVWCADITYIPIGRGFLYLVAIMGLGEPGGPGVAANQHNGPLILHLCAAGGAGALRPVEPNVGARYCKNANRAAMPLCASRPSADGSVARRHDRPAWR